VKDKKAHYNNLFDNNETPLNEMEKDSLFKNIVKTGRKRKARRLLINMGAVVLLLGMTTLSLHNFYNKDKELDIFTISHKNKQLVKGKDLPILLTSDNRGYTLSVDSQQLVSQSQDSAYQIDSTTISSEGGYTTVYIPYGSRREIILPDESRVWLNAGSVLTFNNNMDGETRIAHLDGEGYFDISKKNTQFVIYTHRSTVRVLGTSFNLSSYASDDYQTLDLLTGKVLFESNTNDFSSFEIKAGERVDFNLTSNHVHLNRNSQGDDILWTKKQLKLNKSTIPQLFIRLEKIYNVEIVYGNYFKNKEPYSGRLNLDVDIVTALKSIYELQDYKIELKERKVYIKK
jgi:transmembrane sensor